LVIVKSVVQVWAVMEGVEGIASNFLNLVPDMALTFPFELDTFQKEVGLLFQK
jgi:antiviral helicase SKI2